MEGSINSCMNQVDSQSFNKGRTIDDSPQEESGWTVYFDEFFSNNRQNSASYSSSSGLETPSLVSDAASCAPWKFSDNSHLIGGHQPSNSSKKLRLLNKKKKTSGGVNLDEDALEDTASSPVNSPKRKGISMADDHFTELQTEERNQLGFIGRDSNGYTELNKKGLCLVPLSLFVNNLG
ncbi:hypothetical protein BVC80_1741g125 [Macleaya cordata]|uniref:Uncharacterized protein n=1 Tax=Macleaya cordata TaxID=56857 RepID=A0A200QKS2_MACCD|nr:hypothetical protein BVC80_1741g125 [Macleaya cordata]